MHNAEYFSFLLLPIGVWGLGTCEQTIAKSNEVTHAQVAARKYTHDNDDDATHTRQ